MMLHCIVDSDIIGITDLVNCIDNRRHGEKQGPRRHAMRLLGIAGVLSLLGWLGGMPATAHDCHHYSHYDDCQGCGHGSYSAPQSRRAPATSGQSANLEAVEGRVTEIVYLYGATADSGMVEIRLQAAGQSRLVRLAPSGFLKQGGLQLREGDTVSVKGFAVAGMQGDLIVATEVRDGSTVLPLRDQQGRPAW
jgi:hypothetical protein